MPTTVEQPSASTVDLADEVIGNVDAQTRRFTLAVLKAGLTLTKADVGLANVDDTPAATLLARANHTGTQLASTISDFIEASQDVVGAMVAAAGGSYDDNLGTITKIIVDVNHQVQFAGIQPGADLVGRHFAEIGVVAQHSLAAAGREFAQTLAGAERPAFELELVRFHSASAPS